MSRPDSVVAPASLSGLPRLAQDDGGPVFAEPWQANAFALAVELSEQGHFTWKEWTNTLADDLKAAADRGEPDDGSRYYAHWVASLERLVVAKGLTDQEALTARKDAWTTAYRTTPHGTAVELARARPHAGWMLSGLASAVAGYWIIQQATTGALAEWQTGLAASAGFGSLLGLRHALEPDHLAAVSTLMTGERSSAKAAWLGACWGLGHTVTLLAVAIILVVLRADMPGVASDVFEFGVVLLLVGFGVRALYQGAWQGPPRPTHSHASTRPSQTDRWQIARRPLVVGAVHGLAGSGALTALVATTLPSTLSRLGYLALFGAGTTVGMAALTGLLGWPLARLGANSAVSRALAITVGSVSTVLGLLWSYPLIDRLF